MQDNIVALTYLNQEIGTLESAGDVESLRSIAASVLAFRRRDGSLADRSAYLSKINPGPRQTTIESIQLYGNRAVVACVVEIAGARTHNLRLFVKEQDRWRLLGWANEPV